MKLAARALVLVIALTGAAAVAHSSASHESPIRFMSAAATDFPIPTCPPDDPDACGMGRPQ